MEKKEKIRQDYDLSAEVYDLRYKEIQSQKFRLMLRDLQIEANSCMLDIGCGTGLLQEFLGKKIIGCDISFEMLKKAKARGETAVQANQEHLPFKENSFGTIFSFTSLQNSENPGLMLAEAKRVLRKKGIFVLTYLNKFDFTREIKKFFHISEVRACGEDEGFVLQPL